MPRGFATKASKKGSQELLWAKDDGGMKTLFGYIDEGKRFGQNAAKIILAKSTKYLLIYQELKFA